MVIVFIAVFWLGMYVLTPLVLSWLVCSMFNIQAGQWRFAIFAICVLIAAGYWSDAKRQSWQNARPSAATPAATGVSEPPMRGWFRT